ncbi:MAG TPA: ABC transporter permease [Chloroflexota bacterium]|jgi:ABC-type antimicrobial peptide transport system permease subunit
MSTQARALNAVSPEPTHVIGWAARLPYPVRNAIGRWRSLLSMMLGVGIALSIGMTILAVISAEMDLLTGDYERSGVGVYVATQGGKIVAELAGDTPGSIQKASTVMAAVRSWPEVQNAIGALTWTMQRQPEGPRVRGQQTDLVSVIGITGDPTRTPAILALDSGRWLRGGNEIVVGRTFARDKGLHLGDQLRLNGSTFFVVGIGHLRGFSSFGQNSVAYMDYRTLQQHAQLADVLNVVAIETNQPTQVVRRVDELGGLSSWTPAQLVAKAQAASASGITIDWILILLTLGVAGLFVNTMLTHSVAERRAEFAVLRAIGFPARWIVLTVALESLLITVAAGLIAVAISLVFGLLIDATVAAQYGLDSLFRADPALFLLIFGLAAALGVVSGVLPARKAASVDPVEVLREE